MFKRTFFLVVGLGAGVALGVYAIRKIEETQRRLSPEQLAGSVVDRLATAVAEGKQAAAAKESELRAVYRSRPIPEAPPIPPRP